MNYPLKEKTSALIIVTLHVVGVIGYSVPPLSPVFIWLTPLNLLITFLLMFPYIRPKNWITFLSLIAIYLIGFVSEFLGVNYQLIFGNYQYGGALGLKMSGVPLIIGINWLILTIACQGVVSRFFSNKIVVVISGAFMMVLLDIFIEPVAISFDYWTWLTGSIPLSNYIGWFVISIFTQLIALRIDHSKQRIISLYVVGSQLLFFISLNLFII